MHNCIIAHLHTYTITHLHTCTLVHWLTALAFFLPRELLQKGVRDICTDAMCKGRHQLKKNVFFWALPESPNPPPHDPNSGNLVLFFGSQNSRFESQFRTGSTIYTIQYTVYMQPKKQLKVQYIGIFEEIDSFY